MLLNVIKKINYVMVFALLSSILCFAEEVDYIKMYLPATSHVHEEYVRVSGYGWLRRLFNTNTLQACQKINAILKDIHQTAVHVKSNPGHTLSQPATQEYLNAHVANLALQAKILMTTLQQNKESANRFDRDCKLNQHKNEYKESTLPELGKKIIYGLETAGTLANANAENTKIQKEMNHKRAVEAAYLDTAVRKIWKNTTETDLELKKTITQLLEESH